MCMNLQIHLADCEGLEWELFLDLTDLCEEIAVSVPYMGEITQR